MIERVARAVFVELGWEGVGAHPSFEHDQQLWHKAARAAISAMREPTEDMIEGAYHAATFNDRWTIEDADDYRKAHRAMIDEALNEKSPTLPRG